MTLPKCVFCSNFINDGDDTIMACKAFPAGIPDYALWEPEERE